MSIATNKLMNLGDGKVLYDDLRERNDGLKSAITSGTHEDLTAGNALEVLSDRGDTDIAPYVFRQTGGAKKAYNREMLKKIVGGTVAWNQLVGSSDSSVMVQSGHKYLSKISGTQTVATSDGTVIVVTGGTDNVFDLTQMFGSTIADAIYAMEQATAGSGVAWFRSLFPNDYYAYDAGSLQSVQALSHKVVGFNQWDEEWEAGYLNVNGSPVTGNGGIHSKNFMPCVPNESYYGRSDTRALYICFYDANKNHIKRITIKATGIDGSAVTSPVNACCFKISTGTSDPSNVYNHDICINISDPAKNDTYEPYKTITYPLGNVELRGIPKLDSDGNLYYDGDEYTPDGSVKRRYGVVDLGTLSWTYQEGNTRFYSNTLASLMKSGTVVGLACAIYTIGETVSVDMSMQPSNGYIYVKNTSYTDAATFKTAMSGVYLVYELATPTTETADPYHEIQICSRYGTEEFVDAGVTATTPTRDVSIPAGTETFYPINVVDYIDEQVSMLKLMLTANHEDSMKATKAYNTIGTLIIINGVMYKTTTAISSGETLTVNSNVVVTTVENELSALA